MNFWRNEMKNIILLVVLSIITIQSASAGSKTCKAHIREKVGYHQKEYGINYYDYVDALATVGYEVTTDSEEADVNLKFSSDTYYVCHHGIETQLGIFIDTLLSAESGVFLDFKVKGSDKSYHYERQIQRKTSRKKILKRIYRLVKKLPKCRN